MNTNIKSNIKAIILGLALALGVGYVGATGTFTSPTCAPPGCNTDAPLNVGSTSQGKLSGLVLSKTQGGITSGLGLITSNLAMFATDGNISAGGATFNGPILIKDGTQGNGKVLVSNGIGLASWATSSSVVGGVQPTNTFANGLFFSANNTSGAQVIGILEPGTYKVSGNFYTRDTGGGGWAGYVLSGSQNDTYSTLSASLTTAFGTPTTTNSPDATYKAYDNSNGAGIVFVAKRSGHTDDNVPWQNWNMTASQNITIASQQYVYIMGVQNNSYGFAYFQKQ